MKCFVGTRCSLSDPCATATPRDGDDVLTVRSFYSCRSRRVRFFIPVAYASGFVTAQCLPGRSSLGESERVCERVRFTISFAFTVPRCVPDRMIGNENSGDSFHCGNLRKISCCELYWRVFWAIKSMK